MLLSNGKHDPQIKCKRCSHVLSCNYEMIFGKSDSAKEITYLSKEKDDKCNKVFYLTCENGHTERYYGRVSPVK